MTIRDITIYGHVGDGWRLDANDQENEVICRKSADIKSEPSWRASLEVTLPRFFRSGAVKDVEYQSVKENGEVMDVALSAVGERDDAGEMIRASRFMVDVDERKQAEEALRELTEVAGTGEDGTRVRLEEQNLYKPSPKQPPLLKETWTTTGLPKGLPQKVEAGVIRVLIVDDHEVVRKGIRDLLERADGVTVAGEAVDGAEALEKIRSLSPDVVLLDVKMPKLDGVETLRCLREMNLETRVILLSAYAKDEYIFEGLRIAAL